MITAEDGEDFGGGHIAPQGALYSTYDNIGKNRNTGLSLYLNWNASPKTRIYVNGRGSYTDMKSEAQGLHNYGWNGSFYGGIQHTLPLKLRLSLNGGGSTPYISLQGKGSGYQYYGLSLNRSFLKEDRLSVNLYCNNIFENTGATTTIRKEPTSCQRAVANGRAVALESVSATGSEN